MTDSNPSDKPSQSRDFRSVLAPDSSLFREHPALLISMGYFAVSLIGMMFSWSLFREFGINIFDYAEITDFLMAALREPMTFLVAGGGVLVTWGAWRWGEFERRHFEKRPPVSWFGRAYQRSSRAFSDSWLFMLVFIALYAYLFVSLFAEARARDIRAGGGKHVSVTQEGDAVPRARTLLGTTSRLMFLLDRDGGDVEVVPFESLKGVEVLLREDAENAPPTDASATDDDGEDTALPGR